MVVYRSTTSAAQLVSRVAVNIELLSIRQGPRRHDRDPAGGPMPNANHTTPQIAGSRSTGSGNGLSPIMSADEVGCSTSSLVASSEWMKPSGPPL